MKRPLKIYGWAWAAIIAATIVTFAVMIIYPSHHELAADPYSIEKIVKVDLPDIASVQSMDDLGGPDGICLFTNDDSQKRFQRRVSKKWMSYAYQIVYVGARTVIKDITCIWMRVV